MADTSMFYGASPLLFARAKVLRLNMTEAEERLWYYLRKNQLKGYKFRRQHPIKYFIADFYCHQARLVIEVDGEIHNTQKEYDAGRTYELEELGIIVIRFTNAEVFNNIEKVIEKISGYLGYVANAPPSVP